MIPDGYPSNPRRITFFFWKRHPAAVTLAAIFLTALAIALLPPVRGWAQEGISRFIEVVITPLISPYQAQSPPAEIPLEFTTLQEAQRQVDFHIYQPVYLLSGVKPVGALVSGATSVLLRYEGQGPMRTRFDLVQDRALLEGPTITLGVPDQARVHSTTVNGVEALWLEAPFGPKSVALLCWEKDGFVFSLRVSARTPGLSIEEAVKIAESLK